MNSIYPSVDGEPAAVAQAAPTDGSAIQKSSNGADNVAPKYVDEPGPIEKRKCQDLLFLVLFAVFWIGFIVVGSLASKNGSFDR